jgi:hypothetical protein
MKKLLCLLLALAVLLSLSAPAFAADTTAEFTDSSAIHNYTEVLMLVDLGLISGYSDGSFRPDSSITRAEVAKLITLLSTAEPVADGASVFSDVVGNWAERYIRYCTDKGIIGGDGNGHFRPQEDVTAQELAKMLIIAVGRGNSGYTGAGWADRVDRDASELGIYRGLTSAYDQPITRDDACLLIYNAMQCSAVTGKDASGKLVYALDELMNPKTYLEVRFSLVRYTGVMTGNECADLTTAGGKLELGMTKLAGHKEFAVSSTPDLLGRTVDVYVKNGKVVGLPCALVSEVCHTFGSVQEMKKTLSDAGYQMTADTQYYLNFDPADAGVLEKLPEHVRIAVIDRTGDQRVDMVLIVGCEAATVASLDPLTAEKAGQRAAVEPYSSSDVFTPGEEVWYSEIRGAGYISAK